MKQAFLALVLLAAAAPAAAQKASFTASVDRAALSMGEQLQITFTLSGSGGGSNFRPPSFNDFVVLSGPNQSTNMQFINGAVSSSVSYSYVLQPRADGKFTIGPAGILYDGKTLQSEPIDIHVAKGAPPKKQGGPDQGGADISQQIGDNLFLRASVDRSSVYQGEQITVTYKIYTRVSVVNYGLAKLPTMTGFWSEDLDIPKQVQLTTEVVNGKQYRVGILKKVAVFPQRSGVLSIDPMEVQCVVQVQSRRRSNDIFDQFFNDPFFGGGTTNVNYMVKSEPLRINVTPLPAADIPRGFAGAVGKYSMEAWLDKSQTKTNDPVTLKVKISGRGNLKLLEAPSLSIPPDIEKYDPKISDNFTKEGGLISGSRTFEYLLIPRHAGSQKIPSFPFAYFDVEKKRYVASASPEFTLSVEKGAETFTGSATGINKEDVKLLGEDIRFIKSGQEVDLRRKGEEFLGSAGFFALALSPIAAFIGFFYYVRRREKLMGNVLLVRNRKARKMAQQRLKEARKFFQEHKEEKFYAEISRALWGYLADKLGIPPADLSLETVKVSLASRSVGEETTIKLVATLEQCEFARFAPQAGAAQMAGVYEGAVTLLSEIEGQLK